MLLKALWIILKNKKKQKKGKKNKIKNLLWVENNKI